MITAMLTVHPLVPSIRAEAMAWDCLSVWLGLELEA